MPPKKADTPFQADHELKFAMQVVSRDSSGDATVQCKFCAFMGREKVEVGPHTARKRQRRDTDKLFTKPFLCHKYRSHHESSHAEAWAEYQTLSTHDQKHFFDKHVKGRQHDAPIH